MSSSRLYVAAMLVRGTPRNSDRCRGFTLVELLTVIAIIGTLAAILIPATMSVRNSAKRAKTKVQFGQWAGAMHLFRQEYGYYPQIDGGSGGKVVPAYFAGALTGRTLDGTTAPAVIHLSGNSRRVTFYSISEDELNETRDALVDAFGNTEIGVIYDKNGDDRLGLEDGTVVAVAAAGGGPSYLPSDTDLNLVTGLRAGVIFYSAGKGTTQADLVFSLK